MKKLLHKLKTLRLNRIIKAHPLPVVATAFVCGGVVIGIILLAINSNRNQINSTANNDGGVNTGSLRVSNSPLSNVTENTGDNNTDATISTPTSSPKTNANPGTSQQGTSGSSSSQPSQSSGSSSPDPSNTPPQPSTLANCVFVGGPRDGQACPASAPTSWSYSTPCYGNGSGLPCPPYSQTGWITASYQSGATYCEFDFRGDGNTTGAQYKRVKVSGNNGANAPDCMTAYPM